MRVKGADIPSNALQTFSLVLSLVGSLVSLAGGTKGLFVYSCFRDFFGFSRRHSVHEDFLLLQRKWSLGRDDPVRLRRPSCKSDCQGLKTVGTVNSGAVNSGRAVSPRSSGDGGFGVHHSGEKDPEVVTVLDRETWSAVLLGR